MKLVLYNDFQPGVLRSDGVVDVSNEVDVAPSGQATMEGIIVNWAALEPTLGRAAAEGKAVPVADVQLRAPLPKPGNVIGMQVNYKEGGEEGGPIKAFPLLQSAISDPGATVILPTIDLQECRHEAELVVVIGAEARNVSEEDAFDYVFGYTAGVDIGIKHKDNWGSLAKSIDTFKPIGPCLATKDEVVDPQNLQVHFWVDDVLRHDFKTADMAHPVAEIVSWLSSFTTLSPGDIIFTGTNHHQVGPLQNGEHARIEIESVGSFEFDVSDERKRVWPKVTRSQSGSVTWQNTGGYRHRSGPEREGSPAK